MTPSLFRSDDPAAVKAAVDSLRAGGVALLPTDTVYGLAASPVHDAAIDRIYQLKNRPRDRNLPIMVAASFDLGSIGVQVSEPAVRLLASPLVPGALTLALGIDLARTPEWLAGRDEIAIRIPNSAFMLAVLEQTGPLMVTSANAHGQPTAHQVADIVQGLHGDPDIVVDGGYLADVPSTLINCHATPPVIEREGVIPSREVLAFLA
ncbi:MAG: L-threonylcarbamoyladenylate synthase [Brevundimonas sp.]